MDSSLLTIEKTLHQSESKGIFVFALCKNGGNNPIFKMDHLQEVKDRCCPETHIAIVVITARKQQWGDFFLVWCQKSQEQLAASLYTCSDSGVIHLFALQIPPMM